MCAFSFPPARIQVYKSHKWDFSHSEMATQTLAYGFPLDQSMAIEPSVMGFSQLRVPTLLWDFPNS